MADEPEVVEDLDPITTLPKTTSQTPTREDQEHDLPGTAGRFDETTGTAFPVEDKSAEDED